MYVILFCGNKNDGFLINYPAMGPALWKQNKSSKKEICYTNTQQHTKETKKSI